VGITAGSRKYRGEKACDKRHAYRIIIIIIIIIIIGRNMLVKIFKR